MRVACDSSSIGANMTVTLVSSRLAMISGLLLFGVAGAQAGTDQVGS